jgi:hypothetical protein
MKNMNIASVKLVNGGLKGVVVTYSMTSEKDKRSFIDEHVSKKKAPIHEDLEVAFESLRVHLMDICGYMKDGVNDVTITGVTYNDKGFVITGKKKILDGDKTINLVTPLTNGDDYSEYEAVCKIMDTIYSETEDYMSGAKVFSDAQLVMRFNAGKEDFDVETFKGLSSEEQRDLATTILENMKAIDRTAVSADALEEEGHTVLLTSDVAPEEDGELEGENMVFDDEKEELVSIETKPTMTVVADDDDFDVIETKAPKKSALTMVRGEGDSFKIVADEPKVSTAKRKQA